MLANPYVLLAIVIGLLASHGAVGYKAYRVGQDNVIAETAKLLDVETRTRDAALAAASEAIAKLRPRNVYRTDRIVTETVEKPVYRDCEHDPATFGLLNESLTPPGKRPVAGPGSVSGPDSAD